MRVLQSYFLCGFKVESFEQKMWQYLEIDGNTRKVLML
jgi:hypothetical protein